MPSLREYQETGADFLYERDRAMVLAPVGAGKTAMTLTAMRAAIHDGVVKRFLVLAPKRVAESVWPVEAAKWTPDLPVVTATGTPRQRKEALATVAPVVVTNYDNLQWLAVQGLNFDAVVFDELTRLKNPSGQRFKALMTVIEQMRVRWGLTGSFTSNGLEDVFGQCKVIDQKLLGRSKGAFLQQYFILANPDYGQWVPRTHALPAVMERIKPATYLLDPGDYTDTLPPLNTVEVRCTLADRGLYDTMKRDFVIDVYNTTISATSAAVVTGKLQQMAGGFIYNSTSRPDPAKPGAFIRTQTPLWFSSHKFDALDELLQENQHANTIIAYTFVEELCELKRRYPHALTLDDDHAIDRWNRGEVELLLVHPKSAGHGLNLQHGGSHIVFLSLPWSLELFEQTVGRLHRNGQRHAVWCYVLLTEKTVDEQIWAALHDKRTLAEVALAALEGDE